MRVNPDDGCCGECGGTLDVIDTDDSTMTVQCRECVDAYLVETDAFNDGGMAYLLGFLLSPRLEARKERFGT
jgi:hypothetical protein